MSLKNERSPIALASSLGAIGEWATSTSSPIATPTRSPRGAPFLSPKSPLSFPSFPVLMPSLLDLESSANHDDSDNDEAAAVDTNASFVPSGLLEAEDNTNLTENQTGQHWLLKEEGVFAFDAQTGGDLELAASLSSSPPISLLNDGTEASSPTRRRLSVHDQLDSADNDVVASYWQAQAMLDQEDDQQYQRSLDEFIAYTEEMEAAATASAASSGPPVCRYHLKGKCLRADCWYSHDLKAITCKYWLHGGCLKGDNCEFRHGYAPSSSRSSSSSNSPPSPPNGNHAGYYGAGTFYEGSTTSSPPRGYYGTGDGSSPPSHATEFHLSEDQFPELASSEKKSRRVSGGTPATPVGAESTLDMASRLKLRELQKFYEGVLKPDYIAGVFIARKCSLDDTKAAIRAAYPGIDDYVRARQQAANAAAADRAAVAAGAAANGSAPHSPPKHGQKAAVRWVDTGDSVAGQFQDARSEAIRHAVLRNRLYDEATRAYLSGNKAAAKELSRRGRMHHERMQALHAQASDKIFSLRNPEIAGELPATLDNAATEGHGAYTVDLHGLHVKEALEKVSEIVTSRLQTGQWPHMYVVIGTGHHSWNKKSKLGPAVLKTLTDMGCVYADCSPDGRGGLLKVSLKKKRG